MLLFIFPILLCVLVYAVIIAMPRWYWVLLVGGVLGAYVAYTFHQQNLDLAAHDGVPGDFDFLGEFAYLGMAWSIGSAVISRLLTLWLRHRGAGMLTIVTILIVGFIVPPGIAFAPMAAKTWADRAPTAECQAAPVPLIIGDLHLKAPSLTLLSVSTNAAPDAGVYALNTSRGVRLMCALTEGGMKPVHASRLAISYHFDGPYKTIAAPKDCPPLMSKQDRALCEQRATAAAVFVAGFRHSFDADIIDSKRWGDPHTIGATYSTYQQGRSNVTGDYYFVSDGWRTADGNPWAAWCVKGEKLLRCNSGFPWHDGIHLQLRFEAAPEEIETVAHEIEHDLDKDIETMRVQ